MYPQSHAGIAGNSTETSAPSRDGARTLASPWSGRHSTEAPSGTPRNRKSRENRGTDHLAPHLFSSASTFFNASSQHR